MRYDLVRERIANGDLLLFRGNGRFSRLIKLVTRSVYSHVGIAMWVQVDGVRRLCVIEAKESYGVRFYPLRRYIEAGEAIDWWALSDPQIDRDKVAGWAIAQLGKGYCSWWQLLRSFGRLCKRVADLLGLPTRVDGERFFCSCFATQALLAGGWRPEATLDPTLTPPGEVALFPCLQSRGRLSMTEPKA